MFDFIGDCVGNPFKTYKGITDVVDNAIEITPRTFFKHINDPEIKKGFKEYPGDYRFYRNYKHKVYYYKWSAIEFFYKVIE